MSSTFLDLGVVQISWYSVFILLALMAGGLLVLIEGRKFNLPKDFMTNLIFWMVVYGVIGARLYYVAFNWSYYSGDLSSIVKIWEGGLAIHGGIIGAFLFLVFYAKKYKVKVSLLTDVLVVGLIVAQAIGRWGNFFNKEAHGGEVTRGFLENLHIPDFIISGMKIGGTYYHPTFFYESLWCLLGFVVLFFTRKYKYLKSAQLTGIYLMWYSVGRFFLEGLRTDSLMLGDFRVAQLVSIVLFLIGLIIVSVKSQASKFEDLYSEGGLKNELKF